MNVAVVFLPGLLGSELRKRGTETAFGLSVEAVVGMLRSPETMALPDGDEPLVATRCVPGRQVIPGFVGIHGYRSIEEWGPRLATRYGGRFRAIPYDWRQSVRDSGQFVAETIRSERLFEGVERSIIVGHSMGGLVAIDAALRLNPGEVGEIVTIGTPFGGAAKSLRALCFPWLARLVAALRTYDSMYELLPRRPCVEVSGVGTTTVSEVAPPRPGPGPRDSRRDDG